MEMQKTTKVRERRPPQLRRRKPPLLNGSHVRITQVEFPSIIRSLTWPPLQHIPPGRTRPGLCGGTSPRDRPAAGRRPCTQISVGVKGRARLQRRCPGNVPRWVCSEEQQSDARQQSRAVINIHLLLFQVIFYSEFKWMNCEISGFRLKVEQKMTM